MTYQLQRLRELISSHPDRSERLQIHVEALEATIVSEPDRCLERVRALFEATFHSIAPHLGIVYVAGEDFPAQNKRIIQSLDFALDGHPDSHKIGAAIRRLVGSVNGTVAALAELSNIPGMRHGGSLDWRTLQRHHAMMLGGLCDSLVAFLFDAAWSRIGDAETALDEPHFEELGEFNDWLDGEFGMVEVAGAEFQTSFALFRLDPVQYDAIRQEWDSTNSETSDAEADSTEAAESA